MNKSSPFTKIIGSVVVAIFAGAAALLLVSCKQGGAPSKPADVDYYTCTMHPSVRSQDPNGKCPICGMGLVPVKKKSGAAGDSAETDMNNMPGMGGGRKMEGEEKPSEFNVPVERQQQIGVTYALVKKQPFHHTTRAVGLVASDERRRWDFVPRMEGYIQKLFVFSPGEPVESNAPVLTIYSPELFTAQKEFVNAVQMRDRAQSNNSPDVLNSAGQLVASAKERLRLWNITDDQISELEQSLMPEEYLTLHSPFKGIVQDIGVNQGRKVMPGERVVNISDLSVVWVWAQFYQDDLPMLKSGLPVAITMDSYPGETLGGKISIVDPFLNDATRTVRVRIDVENPDLKLRPGMYVNVELSMDMGEGLAVPAGAVLPTGLHNVAFVDKGEGRLEPRYIDLGREYGGFYEVISGLKENDRVVTSANFLIDAEAQVRGALKSW
jgi:Cu(I)/Ag(I) efflux system membrane fusion protein